MANPRLSGREETKEFYDHKGWRKRDSETLDRHLFGVKEDGPIRRELSAVHVERIRAALKRAGDSIRLLECGCGGNPRKDVLDLCSEYCGVDFSDTGLAEAREQLKDAPIPCQLRLADACRLPFADNEFGAVYSAHMIYHIPDLADQKLALQEMLRVIRPNGVLVLITANPRPLLFPLRLAARLLGGIPWIGRTARSIGRKPPLPYRPATLRWLQRQLAPFGSLEVICHGIPSTHFNQHVTEFRGIGRQFWRSIRRLDLSFPHASAYLGNYVQITVVKRVPAPPAGMAAAPE
jgi:ubiquinone/menaquinone biosynthesis C-methylase UbiE